jgi:hypothetical protein
MSHQLARVRSIVKARGWALRKLRRPARYRGKTIRYVLWDGLGDCWCSSLAEVEDRLRRSAYRALGEDSKRASGLKVIALRTNDHEVDNGRAR